MTIRLYTGEHLISPVPVHFGLNWCTHNCFYCFANLNAPERRAETNDLARLDKWFRQGKGPIEYWYLKQGHPLLVSNDADPFSRSSKETYLALRELATTHGIRLTYQTKGGDPEAEAAAIDGPPTMFYVSLTTDNEATRKKIEPNAPSFEARLDLIRRAKAAGHHVVAGINPLMSTWWHDFEAAIHAMKDAGISHAWIGALHFSRFQIAAMSESVKTRFASEIRYGMGRNKADMGELNYLRQRLIDSGINVFHGGSAATAGFWDPYFERFPFSPTLDGWYKRLSGQGQGKIVLFSQTDFLDFCDIGQPQNLSIYKEYVCGFARSIRNKIGEGDTWRKRHDSAKTLADVIDAYWQVFDYPTVLRDPHIATPYEGPADDMTTLVDAATNTDILAYIPEGWHTSAFVPVSPDTAVRYRIPAKKGGDNHG